MRSASELIGTLEREAADFAVSTTAQTRLGIAVRSRAGGTVVWRDAKDRQPVLDALLKKGGEALGLVLVVDDDSHVTISSSLFEEHRGEVAARAALQNICRTWYEEILKRLQQCGDAKGIDFSNASELLQ